MATTRHAEESQKTTIDRRHDAPAALLPDHISYNLETIQALHARADDSVSRYHRPIETIAMLLGQPTFFYGMVLVVAVWVLINVVSPLYGVAPFDPAPYYWLQGIVGLGAWLTATIVLITQTRQGKLAEQRAHLELQVNLLAEQKPPNSLPYLRSSAATCRMSTTGTTRRRRRWSTPRTHRPFSTRWRRPCTGLGTREHASRI